MKIYSANVTPCDNLLHIYFIPDTPIGIFLLCFEMLCISTDGSLKTMLQLALWKVTNWIIAGNSSKCNNMIYLNAFNLKSDRVIKYIYCPFCASIM